MKQQIFDWIRRGENLKAAEALGRHLKQNDCLPHLRMEVEEIQKDIQECLDLLEKKAIPTEDAQKSQDHLAAKMLDIIEQVERPAIVPDQEPIAVQDREQLLTKVVMALMILASLVLVAEIVFW